MSEDEKLIRRFCEAADYLMDHSLIKEDNLKVRTKLVRQENEPVRVERHVIDVERFESLLLRLRIFCIQHDGIPFDSVVKAVRRTIDVIDEVTTKNLRYVGKVFGCKGNDADLLKLKEGDVTFGSKEVFDLSLYGELFHDNQEKRLKILGLREVFGEDVNDVLTTAIVNKVNAILLLRSLIRNRPEFANACPIK